MSWAVLADMVLLAHALFVIFVGLGVLLVIKWPRLAWLHVPFVLWGVWIEFSGDICPLTPLENHLRHLAGETGYEGDFLARYLLPLVYPRELTREIQLTLGAIALVFNAAGYAWLWRRRRSPAQRDNADHPD